MHILPTLLSIITVTALASASTLQPRSDLGGPCEKRSNCYGGAYCCNKICVLGECNSKGNNAGAACEDSSQCTGGAGCCKKVCKLGSCRMDGTCDADNDCYGWCHNNAGTCTFATGVKTDGKCKCSRVE